MWIFGSILLTCLEGGGGGYKQYYYHIKLRYHDILICLSLIYSCSICHCWVSKPNVAMFVIHSTHALCWLLYPYLYVQHRSIFRVVWLSPTMHDQTCVDQLPLCRIILGLGLYLLWTYPKYPINDLKSTKSCSAPLIWHLQSLQVVSRYCDPQLQVTKITWICKI